MVDRLERLTDLVLVLLRDQRPKSLREIASEVPGYPEAEGEARRQAFERDKRTLRDGGIEVTATAIDGPEQVGYLIRPEDYYLPDLDLEPDEQAALNLAVAGVHLGDPSGRDALWRLGLPASAGARPVAELPALPALPALHAALRARATVRFDYRGETRQVAPALLRFHGGWWYLVGHDLDRGAPRTFRVDRMHGDVSAGEPGSAVLPDGFDPDAALPDIPWQVGEGAPVTVEVHVDAALAALVLDEVGESALAARADDGSVVLHLEVTNTAALRSWLFELGDHAEVLGPPEVRAEVVAWLEAVAGGAVMTTRADAGSRLLRLLAVLTWLARQGRAPVSELSERFGLEPDELIADLELAACCGLPPYSPDQLMEIIVDDQEVVADLGAELGRSRRLTAAEGFALAASARAILAVPGADPEGALGRAVAKLEAVLGGRGLLRVDLREPAHLAVIRDATEERRQLELRYYSASSDRESTRIVDPVSVRLLEGHWYLDGYCHNADGMRRFRVDRVSEARLTGEPSAQADDAGEDRPGDTSPSEAFVPGPEATVAHLAVDDDAVWITEALLNSSSEPRADGRTTVTLAVASTVWFGRLLLRLGPHAEVLDPPELADTGRQAARQLLTRYRRAEESSTTSA